jgi:hypothetical protein
MRKTKVPVSSSSYSTKISTLLDNVMLRSLIFKTTSLPQSVFRIKLLKASGFPFSSHNSRSHKIYYFRVFFDIMQDSMTSVNLYINVRRVASGLETSIPMEEWN